MKQPKPSTIGDPYGGFRYAQRKSKIFRTRWVRHLSRTRNSKKDKQQCLSFLLVTRTGLEPMLPPWKGGVLTAWPTGLIYKTKFPCFCMVAAMRFELMTYRVWTDRSNQLSYAAIWLRRKDSNLRPSGYEPDELPSCSTPRYLRCFKRKNCFTTQNSFIIILKSKKIKTFFGGIHFLFQSVRFCADFFRFSRAKYFTNPLYFCIIYKS